MTFFFSRTSRLLFDNEDLAVGESKAVVDEEEDDEEDEVNRFEIKR